MNHKEGLCVPRIFVQANCTKQSPVNNENAQIKEEKPTQSNITLKQIPTGVETVDKVKLKFNQEKLSLYSSQEKHTEIDALYSGNGEPNQIAEQCKEQFLCSNSEQLRRHNHLHAISEKSSTHHRSVNSLKTLCENAAARVLKRKVNDCEPVSMNQNTSSSMTSQNSTMSSQGDHTTKRTKVSINTSS